MLAADKSYTKENDERDRVEKLQRSLKPTTILTVPKGPFFDNSTNIRKRFNENNRKCLEITEEIEDITWPRGDSKFLFEC